MILKIELLIWDRLTLSFVNVVLNLKNQEFVIFLGRRRKFQCICELVYVYYHRTSYRCCHVDHSSWQEHPGSQITGQTVTTDHHSELIETGINPCLKVMNKFPYVIFCAPPSRSSDYPGDVW